MKQTDNSREKMAEQVQKFLEERGKKALEMIRETVLQEKVECEEVHEALDYFITQYWHDTSRPALLSLCCEAVGGDPDATIPIAIPLSLISGGVDIHDDIIDRSKIKEGHPTVYGKFGEKIALLVGDALIFKGFTLLCKTKFHFAKKMLEIMDVIKDSFFELGESEALELGFRGRLDVTPEEYLSMVKMRATNVEAHARIGAIVGGGTEIQIRALSEFGKALGMLLIIRDDFVDMFEKEELLHRMAYECLPLPFLYAFQNRAIKEEVVLILERKATLDLTKILETVLESKEVKNLKRFVAGTVKKGVELLNESRIKEPIRKKLEMLILATKEDL